MATSLREPAPPAPPSLRDAVSAEEWALRVDLAAAYRLVALYGWDDLIFTHLSARVPGPEHHFLINPYNMMFEEITASSLVKIDIDGNTVSDSPAPVNRAGFVIHSAIHAGREDAAAVLHLHTPHGQAVSAMAEGLLPHTQTAMIAGHDVAYHDFEGIATELDERERLVTDLGSRHTMILRNHGTLTVGASVAEAFLRMYFLERACEAQILMLSAGRAGLNTPNQGVAEKVEQQSTGPGMAMLARGLAWPALLRKLDRRDPSYRE
ncbi:class II aldolase/adducin family protein [Sphingomonas sp. 2SG]|uniref:class II aldolase/adducin family protein n=1 Tax=Sphingomonas sp. 2SG TaxID=2502201 RepID=UPI0010F6607F|nr:class II aldolase/adducin family protein [Sphingomonas sp. 2SG]